MAKSKKGIMSLLPVIAAGLGLIALITIFMPAIAMKEAVRGAEPINGLILPRVIKHISLPKSKPAAVAKQNAARPRMMILIVSKLRKLAASAVAPTQIPSRIVTMFISSF